MRSVVGRPLQDERFCLERGNKGAVCALHGDEGRHDGADGEFVDIAAEDSTEEGGGDAGEDFGAEVAEGEVGDGFVVRRDGGEEFGGAGGFGAVCGDGRWE